MKTDRPPLPDAVPKQPFHRKTKASNGAWVDEGLVELLETLWEVGLPTEYSCQDFKGLRTDGSQGWAYIKFITPDIAERFVRFLNEYKWNGGKFVDFPTANISSLTEKIRNTTKEIENGRFINQG